MRETSKEAPLKIRMRIKRTKEVAKASSMCPKFAKY